MKQQLFGMLNKQRRGNQCTRHSNRQLHSWPAGEEYQGYYSEAFREALVSKGPGA